MNIVGDKVSVSGWRIGCTIATVCAGCGPLASFRPASAVMTGERTAEIGEGVVFISPRPYVEEPTRATGQLWGSIRAASWLKLSAVGAFDTEAAAGGLGAMALPLRTSAVVGGIGAELGYAWATLSVPVSVSPFEDFWIYTAPLARTWTDGKEVFVGVPVGVSASLSRHIDVRAEAQLSWAELKYYNRRLHYGAAVVYSF